MKNLKKIIIFVLWGVPFWTVPVFAETAQIYCLKGDYDNALKVCRQAAQAGSLGEEGYCLMGVCLLKEKNYEEARKNFDFVLNNYPRGAKKQDSILGIADSYYMEGNLEKAEEYYTKLLKDFSDTQYASIAYFRLGKLQRRQGEWNAAEASFSKVVNEYPLSFEAKEAKDYLVKESDFFSIQTGAFSNTANAHKLMERLNKKGFDAYIEKSYNGEGLIYRVKVGKFKTFEEAQKELKRLQEQGLDAKIAS